VLIYDGHCSYCRGFAGLLRRLDRKRQLTLLPIEDANAQALLSAQFDAESGFTMYLFHQGHVYWAQSAAREVAHLLGWPRWIANLSYKIYPAVVRAVSFLTRRKQQVCMPESGACGVTLSSAGQVSINDKAARFISGGCKGSSKKRCLNLEKRTDITPPADHHGQSRSM